LNDPAIQQPVALAANSDGSLIALGNADGQVFIVESEKGKTLYHWQAHHDGIIGLVFSKADSAIISMGADGIIEIWGISQK
jgi:WD40 repeat protein